MLLFKLMRSAADVGLNFLNKTFKPFNIGSLYIQPTYWEAAAIVILLFLLVFTLARLRHLYVHWSFKSAPAMILFGFMLAVIIEGFLILSGKTFLIAILGWKNAPKPISTALDLGRDRLKNVLGAQDEVLSADELIRSANKLPPDELQKFYDQVCKP